MTIIQQFSLFFLALVALALAFKLLVKLRILPILLWWLAGTKVFPQWFASHPAVFYGVLALLTLAVLVSWFHPLIERICETRRAERMIREELHRARVEGRTIDSIQLQNGFPITKYLA